ncbi:M48 family metalloprotease [Hyphomicrobium sp. xq]|uniref:M48 family metalloprotease n=2 Tax=Hyphomicrobium album TaxID=2665159 RepID=A0A6I3KGD7_9HYPH|nr:M48 family metalloprotease [Hyphomicrobium album]
MSMPSLAKRTWPKVAALGSLIATATIGMTVPAVAQGLPLIRDSEIEGVLSDYAKPLFKAAGLGSGRIKMRIVQNDAFNAFVLDGKNVFVHTGTLMQANTPNEVIGVIAHETGHITGGHMAALRARIAKDQTRALLAQILGIGLMVAGGVSGSDGLGGAGQGVMFGGGEVIMRSLLAERRQQESAADQAGLTFLNATKQSGRGMLATFERFAAQEYISDAQKEAFARSHPLSLDRLARLRTLVETSPYYAVKDGPELQLRHDLMRAKLSGYLEKPDVVYNRYPETDQTLPARYARALASFFRGGPGALETALAQTDALIASRPSYPYFWEAKGDLLMRAGRTREAIPALRQALKLDPNSSLIQVQLAGALQEDQGEAAVTESVGLLRKSLIDDENSRAYRLLANSYYKQGKRPEADAMIAQAYFIEGDLKQAQLFAKRAQLKLRSGTPEWLKNDDIVNYKPQT